MADRYWEIVSNVLSRAGIIVIVGDARAPEKSINQEVLELAKRWGKKVIIVFNKCDLIGVEEHRKIREKYPDALLVSAKEHLSTMRLLRKINAVAKGEHSVVGIVGYPNTGKSSIINAIKGRKSAPTSSISGYTKTTRIVRVTGKIKLIDTPGVIPYEEKDEMLHLIISAKNPEKLKDPEDAAMDFIKKFEGKIEKFYGVEKFTDFEETLDAIALKLNMLKKGGVPDSRSASIRIIHDLQNGKIR